VYLVGRYLNRVEVMGRRYSNHAEQRGCLQGLLEMAPFGPSRPILRTPKRVCHRTDPDVVAQIVEGYRDGVPVAELATRLQIDQWTVGKYARLHGLPRRSARLGPRQIEEAARLYGDGHSLAKLAKCFGVATDTVSLALCRAGHHTAAAARMEVLTVHLHSPRSKTFLRTPR
jgi:hypothetical protein